MFYLAPFPHLDHVLGGGHLALTRWHKYVHGFLGVQGVAEEAEAAEEEEEDEAEAEVQAEAEAVVRLRPPGQLLRLPPLPRVPKACSFKQSSPGTRTRCQRRRARRTARRPSRGPE